MKKIAFTLILLLGSLSIIAYTPCDKNSNYSDLSNNVFRKITKELSSFVESETSHTTSDQVVWSKRHKQWTDFAKSNSINKIENVIDRN